MTYWSARAIMPLLTPLLALPVDDDDMVLMALLADDDEVKKRDDDDFGILLDKQCAVVLDFVVVAARVVKGCETSVVVVLPRCRWASRAHEGRIRILMVFIIMVFGGIV